MDGRTSPRLPSVVSELSLFFSCLMGSAGMRAGNMLRGKAKGPTGRACASPFHALVKKHGRTSFRRRYAPSLRCSLFTSAFAQMNACILRTVTLDQACRRSVDLSLGFSLYCNDASHGGLARPAALAFQRLSSVCHTTVQQTWARKAEHHHVHPAAGTQIGDALDGMAFRQDSSCM